MTYDNRAIGVFDSGLGGLTSVRVIEKLLPNEKVVYFGDTGRVPYGTRSRETVIKYAVDDLRFLLGQNIKAVLIACGTVSSIAIDELRKISPVPVIGVVKPASKCAAKIARLAGGDKKGKIAILGTPATAKNGAYVREILRLYPEAQAKPVACPMFVPLVENGYTQEDNEISFLVAKEYISKLSDFSPACIILGCTHYPLIRSSIEKACSEVLGYIPEIVDAGGCAVEALDSLLCEGGICAEKSATGSVSFFVSDETHNFSENAAAFLGREIKDVTKIDIDKQ